MKDKLEVGIYVRTKEGYIAKCTYIDEELEGIYGFDSAIRRSFGDKYDFIYCKEQEKYIIKASHNIIDLIEVGDYVNELPVEAYYTRYDEEKDDYIKIGIITLEDYWKGTFTSVEDIKSIVTKEQFSNMEYRLGDDK